MTSYLKARQVWDVVPDDLQPPNCLFKYAKPITADIHPLVEPHLNGALQRSTRTFYRGLAFCSLDGQTHTAQHNQHNTKARLV
ncbi:hypothetical protein PENNAL_c0246G08581 [Penicillium nalgiovense]|uniref:Uncharacterized protein n=1 Tax=Penicillium nalgiovense TaxID=60175 RepID=A0A1V6WK09_PENNA|nr:hypothetical protein PENNAL_c0246G08581 [Penicillium nalgiovense]